MNCLFYFPLVFALIDFMVHFGGNSAERVGLLFLEPIFFFLSGDSFSRQKCVVSTQHTPPAPFALIVLVSSGVTLGLTCSCVCPQVGWLLSAGTPSSGCCFRGAPITLSSCGTSAGGKEQPSSSKDTSKAAAAFVQNSEEGIPASSQDRGVRAGLHGGVLAWQDRRQGPLWCMCEPKYGYLLIPHFTLQRIWEYLWKS